jgi:hypothetical protein
MKKRMLFALTTFLLITNDIIFAQPMVPPSPDPVPIDGGLGLLAAAGGAYAIKKLKDRKKLDEDI